MQGPPTDSTKKVVTTKNLKGKNTAKVEMIYKRYEVTHTNTRTGSSYTSTVDLPFMHVNNNKPIMLDRHAKALEPYMRYCAQSMAQIAQGQDDIRKSRRFGILMYGVGPAVALSSVVVNGSRDPGAAFFTLLGLGAGTMITGMLGKTRHINRAYNHYEDAINTYNSKCYVGDTTPIASATPAGSTSLKGYFKKGEDPYHYDTVKYNSIESNPMDYTAYGVSLNPFYIERSALNTHVGYTVKGFTYLHSFLEVSAEYSRTYGDNMMGKANGAGIGPWVNEGYVGPIPGARKKANSLNITAAVHLFKWEKDYDYTVKLSRGKFGKVIKDKPSGNVGKQMKSVSLRAGFMTRNQLQEKSNDDHEFESTTVNLSDYENKFTGWPVMMKSNIASVGIALNKVNDIAVTMKNGKVIGYSSQNTTYLDFLYAVSTKFMDNGYYTIDDSGVNLVMTQRIPMSQTAVSKMGFRFGAEQTFFRTKHFGMSYGIELGIAPGPKDASMLDRGYARGKIGIVFATRVR